MVKEKILALLNSVNREGMPNLIKYLENETDFFTAPASTTYHGNTEGGLARHSYNVYSLLKEKNERYKLGVGEITLIITGIFHDLCKANFYIKGIKWEKDAENKWISKEVWKVADQFPVGHGEKSVFLIQRYIQLTDEEIAMIRWHLGTSDAGVHANYPSGFPFRDAMTRWPILVLMQTADMEATYILEREELSTA